jgi:diguanylate cyclase
VPPGEFLPQVEETELMDELTEHVVGLAAEQLAAWRAEGIDLTLAVNVSPRLLGHPELPEELGEILGRRGVEAHEAIIELTETAVMERHEVERQTLDALSRCGFVLSIDDFGTGRSSLDRLDRLPVDELKIDRAFIARMEETEETTLVSAMIRLAHELGMRVVAEGVESRRTVETLRELGCDLVQGYAISRPVPDDELRRWLDRSRVTI